mmetsp:Transcript_545/g.1981  ORF Transcript_545/g.1981 Transcript_545/m.1981 type:complete len:332 (-) Transcript_545:155-1150(-)
MAYLHASAYLLSRAYLLEGSLVLVPLVDMANHCDQLKFAVEPSSGVFTPRGNVDLVAARSYEKGEQVFSSYGPHCDADLFQSFGFTRDVAENYGAPICEVSVRGPGPGRAAVSQAVSSLWQAAAFRGLFADKDAAFEVSMETSSELPGVAIPKHEEESYEPVVNQRSLGLGSPPLPTAADLVVFLFLKWTSQAQLESISSECSARASASASKGFGKPDDRSLSEALWREVQLEIINLSAASEMHRATIEAMAKDLEDAVLHRIEEMEIQQQAALGALGGRAPMEAGRHRQGADSARTNVGRVFQEEVNQLRLVQSWAQSWPRLGFRVQLPF